MTVINLSEITDDFRLIPEGSYDGIVKDCKHVDKDNGDVQWVVTIEVDPGDGHGAVVITKYFTWYGGGLKFAWQNAQIVLGKKIPLTADFDDEDYVPEMIGKAVRIVNKHDAYTGEPRNSVDRFLRVTGDAPAASTSRKKSSLDF